MAVRRHAHTTTTIASSRLLLTLFLLFSTVSGQLTSFQFLPNSASSTFPQCGLSCVTLQQAQTLCVPPVAQGNQATLVGCFCQSGLLPSLKTEGATVCPSCTSPSDQQLLVTWYNTYCSSGGTVGGPSTITTATVATTTATATTTTTGATAGATTTAASAANSVNGSNAPQSWISTHWQWVLMVVILIVGFSLLAVVGIWLKRRYDAKHQNLYHGDDSGLGQPSGVIRARGGSMTRRSPAAGFFFSSGAKSEASNDNDGNSQGASQRPRDHQHTMSMASANASNVALHWGPRAHHHGDEMDIAPVDDPAFVANSSRTDLSTLGGRETPRTGPSRLSVQSVARLNKSEPSNHSPVSPVGPV